VVTTAATITRIAAMASASINRQLTYCQPAAAALTGIVAGESHPVQLVAPPGSQGSFLLVPCLPVGQCADYAKAASNGGPSILISSPPPVHVAHDKLHGQQIVQQCSRLFRCSM